MIDITTMLILLLILVGTCGLTFCDFCYRLIEDRLDFVSIAGPIFLGAGTMYFAHIVIQKAQNLEIVANKALGI